MATSTLECCIPMCWNNDTGDHLVQCCENGHHIHSKCMQYLCSAGNKVEPCPMCRSNAISRMCIFAAMPEDSIDSTFYCPTGATLLYLSGLVNSTIYNNTSRV